MSDSERLDEIDLDANAFESNDEVAMMPYKKGSEEDLAIRRIIGEPPPKTGWLRTTLGAIWR